MSEPTSSSYRSSSTSFSSFEPGSPCTQSFPSKSSTPSRRKTANLRSLTINFQNIRGDREVFWTSDIIFGCEMCLKPEVCQGEFFPSEYNLYRKDSRDGYGGVLLGVHTSLTSQQTDLVSAVEMVAAKMLSGKQHIVISAFYRTPDNNASYMNILNQTVEDLCKSIKPRSSHLVKRRRKPSRQRLGYRSSGRSSVI